MIIVNLNQLPVRDGMKSYNPIALYKKYISKSIPKEDMQLVSLSHYNMYEIYPLVINIDICEIVFQSITHPSIRDTLYIDFKDIANNQDRVQIYNQCKELDIQLHNRLQHPKLIYLEYDELY